MLHGFNRDVSEIELPERFTFPFCYVPHPLVVEAAKEVQDYLESCTDWCDEIGKGKMFGVLVVRDKSGKIGFLAAYSGNIAHSNNHPYFVPPIYDLLQPDGFFKTEEANISAINAKIQDLESSDSYKSLLMLLNTAENEAEGQISKYSSMMKEAKALRDAERKSGNISKERNAELIKESQFQKAELRRIKKSSECKIAALKSEIRKITDNIDSLKSERKLRSADLQQRLFDKFQILNANGETAGLCEIFKKLRNELPPAGAGECAAPKMLQYAFANGLHPIAMGEFWWGESPKTEIRRHLHFYPACKSKCEPILGFMLKGLDMDTNPLVSQTNIGELKTLYEDSDLWIVDKPAGMLSVPGKTEGISVLEIARMKFPDADCPLIVHRLDMHTSGIMVIAKNKAAHKEMQRQFECREVKKTYLAILDGCPKPESGTIELPLRCSPENRPMQVVDHEFGKHAVTEYRVVRNIPDGSTIVEFHPLTGRTHQLRVHSSHHEGLGCPIKGDMLYGIPSGRLHLHASEIEFHHPSTGRRIKITSAPPFLNQH